MFLTIITTNVSADFLAPTGVPTWDERKHLYAQAVRDAQPTIIGLQEATLNQTTFWQAQLPEYTALTVSAADPTPELAVTWAAKYAKFGLPTVPSPYEIVLFYETAVCQLIETGFWWLSPTPERPSIGWGNSAPRVVLWAHLHHRPTGQEIVIFNTHIDHRCPDEMVALCRARLAPFIERNIPLIFMGDLNFNPTTANYALLKQDGWLDTHDVVRADEESTFLYDLANIPGGRIDHILYRGDALHPQTWSRLLSPDPTRRLSDHDPVCVRFHLGSS